MHLEEEVTRNVMFTVRLMVMINLKNNGLSDEQKASPPRRDLVGKIGPRWSARLSPRRSPRPSEEHVRKTPMR